MGRMQMKGKGKGISGSALPFKRKSPKWLHMSPSSVVELSVKLAKKGSYFFLINFFLFLTKKKKNYLFIK